MKPIKYFNRRKVNGLSRLFLVLTLASLMCFLDSCKKEDPQKLNVILILTDDQGYGDLSCNGNPLLKTPNLDKLADESICFTDFHVAPMCSPTRGELMTGKCAFSNGSTFVCQGKSMPRAGLPTIADLFKMNGYATGIFGKWHLGDSYPYRPIDRGFDEAVNHGAWGITSMVDYWENDYWDDKYNHNGVLEQYEGYCTDVWFREATNWIKKQQAEDKPFFCYIPTNVPHAPLRVDEAYSTPYIGTKAGERAAFFGMIAHFDEAIGRFEQFLDESGLRENTILIFMTDNGTASGEIVYNAGMRGKKTQYYEGGHRVPFFISCPALKIGSIPQKINELTHSTDIMPTLVELCQLNTPEQLNPEGVSLAGLIMGDTDNLDDRMFVIQYGAEFTKYQSCVLWDKWRLVFGNELYNINDDPGQENDIASKHPEVVEKMKSYYEKWYQETLLKQGKPNYVGIGSEQEKETFFCSANWEGGYADNFPNIRKTQKFGYWELEVLSDGEYEFNLCHWPKEANLPIAGPFKAKELEALPIGKAKLKLGVKEMVKDVDADDVSIPFKVKLKTGEKMRLEPTFLDKQGNPLCGAYFTYVKKL